MSVTAPKLDPEFPNLSPEVAAAYRAAPEHVVVEIVDGELHAMPRPRRQHGHASTRLTGRLSGFHDPRDGDPGGWLLLDEPELRLGPKPDIVVPDLAGWRRARLPEDFFAESAPPYIDLAPDWICEVLSPSTEAMDRGRKLRVYRREGVAHVWLLAPSLRTLEIYRLENGRYSMIDTHEGDESVNAEPFDAIALELRALWAV